MDIKIQIDPEKDPELHERLCEASQILEEIMGPGAARFVREVKWSQFERPSPAPGPEFIEMLANPDYMFRMRKSRPLKGIILLELTDPLSGTESTVFEPGELKSPRYMEARLRELWGDFLQQLFDERMERVDQLIETAERA